MNRPPVTVHSFYISLFMYDYKKKKKDYCTFLYRANCLIT